MLSEEEKKAIEYLKILKKHLGKDKQEMIDTGTYKFYEAFEINLDIVLNLITKLQKENEEKDKQIDLLSEKLAKAYHYKFKECTLKNKANIDCNKYNDCVSCVKQYFEKLAKEKGE